MRVSQILKERRFSELEMALDRAMSLLKLVNDWDGEGATAIRKETLDRTVHFLRQGNYLFRTVSGRELDIPRISPGPNGGIDLYWKLESFQLLLHIPSDVSRRIEFYGESADSTSARGFIDNESISLPFFWMAQFQN